MLLDQNWFGYFFFYILAYNQVIDFQTVWVEKVSWYLKSGKEEARWNYKLSITIPLMSTERYYIYLIYVNKIYVKKARNQDMYITETIL